MKKLLLFICLSISFLNYSQTVSIPDANFEQSLIDLGFDSNGLNGNILLSEAQAIDSLKIYNPIDNEFLPNVTSAIQDLTGIEAFSNLVYLNASDNEVSSVNTTSNTNLKYLDFSRNSLSAIDVTSNLELEVIGLFQGNPGITSVDLSQNTKLTRVTLTYLDNLETVLFGSSPDLVRVQLAFNKIETLDISGLTGLETLIIPNQLTTSLDVSNNLNLNYLWASDNQLTDITFGTNPELASVLVHNNQLTGINVSALSKLEYLRVYNNQLTSVDVNTNPALKYLWYGGAEEDLGGGSETNRLSSLDVTNNPILEQIIIAGTQDLSSLDLSNNPELTLLNVNNNNLTTLDISGNDKLKNLAFGANPISSISIEDKPELEELYAWETLISELELSNNPNLFNVDISGSNLSELDLGIQPITRLMAFNMPNLIKLNMNNGNNSNVTEFNMSNNPELTCIQVDDVSYATSNWTDVDDSSLFNTDCGFSTLDLVSIPDANFEQSLIDLGFDTNGLNGNILLSEAQAIDSLKIYNPIDNEFLPNVNQKIQDLAGIEAFSNLVYLNAFDNEVSSVNTASNTNLKYLDFSRNGLSAIDVTSNLELERIVLFQGNPGITSVDLSKNTKLTAVTLTYLDNLETVLFGNSPDLVTVQLAYNKIETLDISGLTGLESLMIPNQLTTSLDVSNNLNLNYLWASDNQLTDIDVSSLSNLETLRIDDNQISTLDLSNNPELSWLEIRRNNLSDINLTNNLKMQNLFLGGNPSLGASSIGDFDATIYPELVRLDLDEVGANSLDISTNSKIEELYISVNNFTSLDFSGTPDLRILVLSGNNNLESLDLGIQPITELYADGMASLTKINMNNGNNGNVTVFRALDNPNLNCIQVDDVSYATTNWTDVDESSVFNTDCGFISDDLVAIPDSNFEQSLIDLGFDSNGLNGNILLSEAQAIDSLKIYNPIENEFLPNVTGKIQDLTGIEAFSNLVYLDAKFNELEVLDLSKNNKIEILYVSDNQLTFININSLTQLYELNIGRNNLTTIDLSTNTSLLNLYANTNSLSEIEISTLNNLENLQVIGNSLNSIDLSNNTFLIAALLANNNLATIDLSNNLDLRTVWAYDNELTDIDVSLLPKLEYLRIYNNQLTSLDVNNNPALKYLWFGGAQEDLSGGSETNRLSSLDVSNNPILEEIIIAGAQNVNSIDLSNNPELTLLNVNNNNLSSLNINVNDKLKIISFGANPISLIALDDKPDLEEVFVWETSVVELDLSSNDKLKSVFIDNNENLTGINLKNDNNQILESIQITSNPNLSCIQVDDVSYATTNWTNVDDSSVFGIACLEPVVNIPDVNMKAALVADTFINTNGDDEIQVSEAAAINQPLTGSGLGISDLTGIEAFINITGLDVSNNNLTSADITKNTKLLSLDISNNNLTGVDLTNNMELESLNLSNNNIINVDINQNVNLSSLFLNDNSVERAYLINGNNTLITSFDIRNNPNLVCIAVDNIDWSNTNWINKDNSAFFNTDCSSEWEVYTEDETVSSVIENTPGVDADGDGVVTYEEAQNFTGDLDLSGQNVSDITGLEAFSNASSINISGNIITDISNLLSANTVVVSSKITGQKKRVNLNESELSELYVANNLIESIDAREIYSLIKLDVSNNSLSTLFLDNGSNTSLTDLNTIGNANLGCIQVDNVDYANNAAGWLKDSFTIYSTNCQAALSIDELLAKSLKLYPNPVKDKFKVELSNQFTLEKIELYNLIGKKIIQTGEEQVNLSHLPSGIYMAVIKTNKGSMTKKIVKQ